MLLHFYVGLMNWFRQFWCLLLSIEIPLDGVMHFDVVDDASTHSCQETLVSLAYTWENDLGVHLTAQSTPHGKHLT